MGHHIKAQKTVDFGAFQIWNVRLGMLDTYASACIHKTYMYENHINKKVKGYDKHDVIESQTLAMLKKLVYLLYSMMRPTN